MSCTIELAGSATHRARDSQPSFLISQNCPLPCLSGRSVGPFCCDLPMNDEIIEKIQYLKGLNLSETESSSFQMSQDGWQLVPLGARLVWMLFGAPRQSQRGAPTEVEVSLPWSWVPLITSA